jgi:hypothetical protein
VTVEEMHIAINQGVQKIASFQADTLLPEEIDLELNFAVRRFINQKYNSQGNKYKRGFEQSQKRLDDLRNLVEDFTGYTGSYMGIGYTSRNQGNIHIYRYKFPTDYMYLVNVLSEVTFTCKNDALPVVEGGIYRQYLRIPLSPPQPGYLIKQIEIADSTGAPTAIISALGGLTLDDLLSDTYAESVIPSLSNNDSYSDRYFETASADSPPADSNELYLQKQYTSAEETADPSSVGFKKISGATVGADDSVNVNGAYAAITWVRSDNSEQTLKTVINSDPSTAYLLTREFDNTAPVNSVDYSISDIGILRTNCKFVQQDDIYAVLDDPFNSTKEDGILYTVQETFVDLYTTQSFVPNSIQLKYIRKPRDINKSKGIGCELPEHTHHEIVEMAVKSILEGFESPRYNTQSGEVLESE